MPIVVKHVFVNPKADSLDPTIVRASNWNADHVVTGEVMIPGAIIDFCGATWPSYFLECYGQSVASATYPLLFAAMVKQASATLTISSPGVVNWATHGLKVFSRVKFRTTGALPTGVVSGTDYYVSNNGGFTANSFRITNTPGGTNINFTGSQSGIHTVIHAPYGAPTDLTSFTIPDLRGRVNAGYEMMGATDETWPSRLNIGTVEGRSLGAVGGSDRHLLTVTEMPAHAHGVGTSAQFLADVPSGGNIDIDTDSGNNFRSYLNTNNAGGGAIHNNVQPTIVIRKLIYTG